MDKLGSKPAQLPARAKVETRTSWPGSNPIESSRRESDNTSQRALLSGTGSDNSYNDEAPAIETWRMEAEKRADSYPLAAPEHANTAPRKSSLARTQPVFIGSLKRRYGARQRV